MRKIKLAEDICIFTLKRYRSTFDLKETAFRRFLEKCLNVGLKIQAFCESGETWQRISNSSALYYSLL